MILAASAPADTGPRIGTDKKIIKTGQDRPTPAYLRDHVAEMERLPFDGLAIALERPGDEERHLRRLEYQWWQPRPIEQQVHEDTVAVLAPVPFSRFTDNFLWISTQSRFEPAPSWTDEEAFAAIRRNMVLAARIAKDAGLKGIFVDVEQYGGMRWSRWMMRFNYPYAHSQEPGMVARGLIDRVVPFEEYVDATRARAREIMAAMCAVHPDITVIVLPGLHQVALERVGTGRHFVPDEALPGLAGSDCGLLAAFGDGLLEGMSERATLVDGYEGSYAYTLNKRFVAGRRRTEQAVRASAVPELYRARMKVGFGLMLDNRYNVRGGWHSDANDFHANHFTPMEWGHALYFGLLNADRYVWIWNEKNGAVFFPDAGSDGPPANVPEAYHDAMRAARDPRPLDAGRDNARALAMPVPADGPDYDEAATYGPLAGAYEIVDELPETWRYLADDESLGIGYYTALDLDESGWTTIRTNDFLQRLGQRFRGLAWFRCRFHLPARLEGQQVCLLFGGVSTNHFHVNGRWLQREQKHGVWIVDFTEVARFGQKNLVALSVVTQGDAGGLYAPVKLAVKRR